MTAEPPRIGTAGWSVPIPGAGTHLQRYGRIFNAVEINSSFYRPHRRATYERWAASVPEDFSFAVKLPKAITHERKLKECGDLIERFSDEVEGLGAKFGTLLVQLPPSLAFSEVATGFLRALRPRFTAAIALEPRHQSWFAVTVEDFLRDTGISRVAADPARFPGAGEPGGDLGTAYFRLHGSPPIYYSRYDEAALAAWSERLRDMPRSWVIFDNTAEGAAFENARQMRGRFSDWR